MHSRRQFLQRSLIVGGLTGIVPTFLWQARTVRGSSAGAPASAPADRTLVVLQMAGGNDGLNMAVPFTDGAYMSARPTLHIDPSTVLPLTDRLGLNPQMTSLKPVWDAKQLAIIEGVGYPKPTYSHFESMSIWQTGSPTGDFHDGWLGRYFKQSGAETNALFGGIDVGAALAPALREPGLTTPVVQAPAAYRLALDPRDAQARLEAWQDLQTAAMARQAYLPLIGSTAASAYQGTQVLSKAVSSYQPAVEYGKDPLSGGLRLLASMIVQEPGTKVGYITLGGFDTHTGERRTQDTLLKTLADAMATFHADIAAHGKAEDVLLVTWSEFGRRVKENGSQGTDHGDGGTMLVAGGGVSGGIYGDAPDLTRLDSNGSVMWNTDFRSVYATLLEDWLGVDSTSILGGRFPRLDFVAA